jgi:hypothetical protein
MAGDHRAPKTVIMSLYGHYDGDLVIFECQNISNMADGAILDLNKWPPTQIKCTYNFGMLNKTFVGTGLITCTWYFGDFSVFKMAFCD